MCGIAGLVGPLGRRAARAARRVAPPSRARRRRRRRPRATSRSSRAGSRSSTSTAASSRWSRRAGARRSSSTARSTTSPSCSARLERRRARFSTDHSDTEVVLRALRGARRARGCTELNGMFAFAILDRERRELVAARDRFGIKPLYYARLGARFAFASELRTLLRVPGVERELDRESLFHYLSLRFVPGERSISRGVQRLAARAPARVDLDSRRLDVERWWRLEFGRWRPEPGGVGASGSARPRRGRRAGRSPTSRSRARSPAGSTRAPSSRCSRRAARRRAHVLARVRGRRRRAAARPRARRALRHRPPRGRRRRRRAARRPALRWCGRSTSPTAAGFRPGTSSASWPRTSRSALTGTGGDELFGNYRRFVPFEQARLARFRARRRAPLPLRAVVLLHRREKRELLRAAGPDTSALLQRIYDESGSSQRARLGALPRRRDAAAGRVPADDRPLLDGALARGAHAVPRPRARRARRVDPARAAHGADDPKGLLRDAVADLLTPAHLEAPKRGFVFPLARWLRGELRPLAERLLADEHLARAGPLPAGARARYLEPHLDGRADESERLWPLLMFQLWHLLYVEEALTEAPSFSWRELTAGVR